MAILGCWLQHLVSLTGYIDVGDLILAPILNANFGGRTCMLVAFV